MHSRDLADLYPSVASRAHAHIAACKDEGIDLLVTCTFRTVAEQNKLYAQGRTAPGNIVTNAKGGESLHNYRVAYDVVPLRHGKPVWGTTGEDGALWAKVGALGKAQGLEWAGDWKKFREFPHFQYTNGHPISYFRAGGVP